MVRFSERSTSLGAAFESDEAVLGLECTEVMAWYHQSTVELECTEYRATDDGQKPGNSFTIELTDEQLSRIAQLITDWLNSRTKNSLDQWIGEVNGKMRLEDVYPVTRLRVAIDERGVFFTPGTRNDWPTPIRIPDKDHTDRFDNITEFRDYLLDLLEIGSEESPETSISSPDEPSFTYDLFVCHSSADKEEIVQPLVRNLERRGVDVWYDDFEISIGDDIREAIEEGISDSRYGIVVLSPDFVEADWAGAELSSLTAREHSEDIDKILLPVRYEIEMDALREHVPLLASRFAREIQEDNVDEIAKEIDDLIADS